MKTVARRPILVGGLLVAAVTTPGWLFREPPPVTQPMAFSHVTHVQGEEIGCKECHDGLQSAHAGFPSIRYCKDCHSEPEGEHPDEPKVRDYLDAKREIPWVPVTRNAGHVYFSHRVHTSVAGMECEACHGKVEEWEEPPTRPNDELLSMHACIVCHEDEGATIDCLACHD